MSPKYIYQSCSNSIKCVFTKSYISHNALPHSRKPLSACKIKLMLITLVLMIIVKTSTWVYWSVWRDAMLGSGVNCPFISNQNNYWVFTINTISAFLSFAQFKHQFVPFKDDSRPSPCDALRSATGDICEQSGAPLCPKLNLALTVPLLITTCSADHTGL